MTASAVLLKDPLGGEHNPAAEAAFHRAEAAINAVRRALADLDAAHAIGTDCRPAHDAVEDSIFAAADALAERALAVKEARAANRERP